MAKFPGFSNNSSSSSSSIPSFGFGSAPSTPANPLFGSSSSNGFSFPSSSSTPTTQTNDEATIKKILEAIEILEKLAQNGTFPKEKLQEIKQELEKKYPNLFIPQNTSQKPGNNNTNSSQNSLNSNNNTNYSHGWESFINQQQEFYNNYNIAFQQQINQQVQAQSQIMDQYMKIMLASSTTPASIPNYHGYNYLNYNYPSFNPPTPIPTNYGNSINGSGEAMKMFFEMMGKISTPNDALSNNAFGFGSTTTFGSDGFTALSFLGSLLGGFGF
ncbi:unnamed protein product [Amaranthus hypochondriacus]